MKLKFLVSILLLSSTLMAQENCQLLLSSESVQLGGSKSASVDSKRGVVHFGSTKKESVESRMIVLSPGLPGRLTLDQSALEVVCFLTAAGANITLSLSGGDKGISTSLSLTRGDRFEIGQIAKDLADKNREIGFPSGVKLEKNEGLSTTKFYLTVR